MKLRVDGNEFLLTEVHSSIETKRKDDDILFCNLSGRDTGSGFNPENSMKVLIRNKIDATLLMDNGFNVRPRIDADDPDTDIFELKLKLYPKLNPVIKIAESGKEHETTTIETDKLGMVDRAVYRGNIDTISIAFHAYYSDRFRTTVASIDQMKVVVKNMPEFESEDNRNRDYFA